MKTFRVRKSAVLAWLNFLKEFNPLYAGIEVGEAEDLPEDSGGSLDHLNCHVQEEDALSKFDDTMNQEGILHSVVDGWGGGPALENPLLIESMKWPDRGTDAIKEFGTPNILAKCFPTVFPWGVGDPTSPSRTTGVTLSEGIHHLQNFAIVVGSILRFPFAEHRVAPYYAHDVQVTPTHYHLYHLCSLYSLMRLQLRQALLGQSSIYLKQRTSDFPSTRTECESLFIFLHNPIFLTLHAPLQCCRCLKIPLRLLHC